MVIFGFKLNDTLISLKKVTEQSMSNGHSHSYNAKILLQRGDILGPFVELEKGTPNKLHTL